MKREPRSTTSIASLEMQFKKNYAGGLWLLLHYQFNAFRRISNTNTFLALNLNAAIIIGNIPDHVNVFECDE